MVERIVSLRGSYLYLLDARTGHPAPTYGTAGRISFERMKGDPFFQSGGPLVAGDLIIVGGGGSQASDYSVMPEGIPNGLSR